MTVTFDEKGKVFTRVISKEAVPVIVQTLTHRLQGNFYVRQGERIKDELALSEQFVAVTDAVVFQANGEELYRTAFMAVNRDHIVWLIPAAEISPEPESGGSQ
jgi:hypothetical protein